MKTTTRIVGALMALFLFVSIGMVGAQEETATVEAVATGMPVPETPIIVNVGTAPADDAGNTSAIAGWAAIAYAAGLLTYRLLFSKTEAERLDAIRAAQSNRVAMTQAETAYQSAAEAYKKTLDAALNVLDALKGLIPGKVDDALVALGRDVQTPGAPE